MKRSGEREADRRAAERVGIFALRDRDVIPRFAVASRDRLSLPQRPMSLGPPVSRALRALVILLTAATPLWSQPPAKSGPVQRDETRERTMMSQVKVADGFNGVKYVDVR